MQYYDLLNKYTTDMIARNLRESHIAGALRTLSKFVQNMQVPPSDLTPSHIVDYLSKLSSLQPSTRSVKRGQICAFLNWASSEEYLPDINWSQRVPKIKVDDSGINSLTPEEVKRLLVAVDVAPHNELLAKRRDKAMLYILLDTGIREGELLRLDVADVNLERREISISSECKGRRRRTVYMCEETAAVLRNYLRFRRKYPGVSLWVTRMHTRPSKSLLLAIIKRYGRVAGISNITVHKLRHTAITQMCRNGMSLAAVSSVAGHSQIRTTMRYTHLINDDVRREAEDNSPVRSYI